MGGNARFGTVQVEHCGLARSSTRAENTAGTVNVGDVNGSADSQRPRPEAAQVSPPELFNTLIKQFIYLTNRNYKLLAKVIYEVRPAHQG